jgi:hypothetical protein
MSTPNANDRSKNDTDAAGPRRRRTREERRAARAAGIDRKGQALPRAKGTNPRDLGTNPRANRGG